MLLLPLLDGVKLFTWAFISHLSLRADAGERDEYMANAIVSAKSRKLVGVVGLGHLAGIEQYLTSSGLQSVLRDCSPLSAKQ